MENNLFIEDEETLQEFLTLASDLDKESESNNEVRTSAWATMQTSIDYGYNPFDNKEVQK